MLRHVKRIRVRFALWTAGLILLLLVAFGAFVYYRVAQGLTDAVDEALNLSAAQTLTALNVENGVITLAEDFPEVDNQSIEMMERGLTVRVLDASGRTVQAFGPQRSRHHLPIRYSLLAQRSRSSRPLQREPRRCASCRRLSWKMAHRSAWCRPRPHSPPWRGRWRAC
ncbi:MAG: hypothetical protein IPM07_15205 [Anaerolineales bacterium]|nr:hypothetical protein [Anaerolineales bacterium]